MTESGQDESAYAEWAETMDAILSGSGLTLVLGGVDVGKTTFTRCLVRTALQRGLRIALVDSDLGQSEIGPPACVGLAVADVPTGTLSLTEPAALAFVGSVSPAGHLPEHLAAIRRLVDLAGDRRVIVDTGGYIQGIGARRLAQAEFDMLAPTHVVALQRQDELLSILSPMRRRSGCTVYTPPIPAVICRKPATLRIQRRAMRFAAYLRDSRAVDIPLETCAVVGAWIGGGAAVPAHILQYMNETLRARTKVFYAEQSGRHLGMLTLARVPAQAPEVGLILEQLKAGAVSITPAATLKHLLLGLEASNGKLLGLGVLTGIDFKRRALTVLTPIRTPDAIAVVRFGTQRIRPDGSDAGALRPGEL